LKPCAIILAILFALALIVSAVQATDPYEPVPGALDGLTVEEVQDLEREREASKLIDQEVSRGSQIMVMEATAYCHGTITATGTKPTPGRTVAADPSILPYGTELIIDGVPGYVVEDCGGDIRGARLDIFVEDYATAINFGRRTVEVRILE
jgi:3D (Asp-Asp-Asp) domain-containing protein